MNNTNNLCNLIDGETIRIAITALTGLLGTLLGGLINYFMTKGQMDKELKLERTKYENECKLKKEAEKQDIFERKKILYAEYIEVAVRYATTKDNLEDLKKKTIDILLIGSNEVSKAVSNYFTDINDEINRDFPSIKHDKHINNILNAIRNEISEEADVIYIHLVDNDKL